jgi:hypothetical protein
MLQNVTKSEQTSEVICHQQKRHELVWLLCLGQEERFLFFLDSPYGNLFLTTAALCF